jgi:ArsR family transcriptional regulator, arsenate/arsenite/antimonite-responsive transcriptional repressor
VDADAPVAVLGLGAARCHANALTSIDECAIIIDERRWSTSMESGTVATASSTTPPQGGARSADSPVSCCTPLGAAPISHEEARTTAEVFKALADPHRVRILSLLAAAGSAVCVCDLTPALGISQPTVSHHLKKLLTVGLVDREQRGTWSYYSLNAEAATRLATIADLREVTR